MIHKRVELSRETSTSDLSSVAAEAKQHNHHQGRSVFVGGVPHLYQSRYLAHLALPTVAYELHFRGAIRNVLYAAADSSPEDSDYRMQHPLDKSGLLLDQFGLDAGLGSSECHTQKDRCQHGGFCYQTQAGTYCDCSVTDFEGPYCQKGTALITCLRLVRLSPNLLLSLCLTVERHTLEAAFRGTLDEYLGYNHAELPDSWSFVSTSESFEVSFRTKLANGLLLLTGDDEEDYLVVAIRDAALALTMKLGSVVHQKTVKPSKVRFDDNQWHTVLVHRKIREVSDEFDGAPV